MARVCFERKQLCTSSWFPHRYAASIIARATFGREVESMDDAYVKLVEKSNAMTLEVGSPGATIIDLFPPRMYPDTFA